MELHNLDGKFTKRKIFTLINNSRIIVNSLNFKILAEIDEMEYKTFIDRFSSLIMFSIYSIVKDLNIEAKIEFEIVNIYY